MNRPPELLNLYYAPDVKRGDHLTCKIRGKVRVGGYTTAPIAWPRILTGGRPVLILCGDLVRAVKMESVQAIVYWWGVSADVVRKWRRTLGVGRVTPGTRKLHQDLFDSRISDEARRRGLDAMHTPKVQEKAAKAKQGQAIHPNSLKALAKARIKSKGKAWKAKMADSMRQQWAEGKRRHPQAWTDEELSLLGTDTDKVVAEKIERSVAAVAVKRRQMKIKLAG